MKTIKFLFVSLFCLLLCSCQEKLPVIVSPSGNETNHIYYIDIKGAVKYPGIYEFSNPIFLYQLLDKVGGVTKMADLAGLNLLLEISETQSIVIPTIEQNSSNDKININYASVTLLTELPQIGITKAQNIVAYRMQQGMFKKIEDIMKVSGIGAGIFEAIKDHICV